MRTEPGLRILVIDDDPLFRALMAKHLDGHRADFAADAAGGMRKLDTGGLDICFIDLQLGEKDSFSGMRLVEMAAAKGIYSVVVSGHDTEPLVEKAYALGCRDFYAKGTEDTAIRHVITRFLQQSRPCRLGRIFTDRFITQDLETRRQIHDLMNYAATDIPVLILGPSGTGKTSLARLVHELSGRAGEFVSLNCSAYTEDLLEAELFGFRHGAFTGAIESRKGRLLAADQGTLFLDEIGSMSLSMQAKLLKAIEEQEFFPLGSDVPETSDFRVVSATWEDPESLVHRGKLRPDFFGRIQGAAITLKGLSERRCDIFPLIEFFSRRGKRLCFTAEAKKELLNHRWPGNVRELKRLVDLLAAGPQGRVTPELLRPLMRGTEGGAAPEKLLTDDQYAYAVAHGLPAALERLLDQVIHRYLRETGGSRAQAIANLRISRRQLYASLSRYPGASAPR